MIEIMRFIFSDLFTFLGTVAILLILAWAISNFTLVRIIISHYHLVPGEFSDSEVDDE